ncbi:MAG TPA: cystathionine gamma-lyase [Candidatus Krumholzibacteria bacterium]|nr:cystathionine gamma-lyase [Candidatus Krumholzibacteria bacterium]
MHRDTEILHAGYGTRDTAGPVMAGPQFSSTYVAPGAPSEHRYTYGRTGNPTWTAWEQALSMIDEGESIAFASGMAAINAVFGTALKPGDIAVLPNDCYYTTRMVASGWLQSIGVEVRMAPTRDNAQAGMLDGARLLWIETPSNPELQIADIELLVRAARKRGALVAIDNTTATGYLQHPMRLGVDYVVASDTKALTGHSDLILGHVTANNAERATALRAWRTQHGAIPGPMEVWLAHRSLATLPLRSARQCATALELAHMLAKHTAPTAVHYPGLPAHPGHEVARRQMDAFGSVVSFDLETQPRAETFLRSLQLVRYATSFGGVHSTAERRARWGGDAISDGFIRFSVGCETPADLLDDVKAALDRL